MENKNPILQNCNFISVEKIKIKIDQIKAEGLIGRGACLAQLFNKKLLYGNQYLRRNKIGSDITFLALLKLALKDNQLLS